MRYAAPLSPTVDIRSGDWGDLAGAGVVLICAGVNEKSGGATDRADERGRLRLLESNASLLAAYRERYGVTIALPTVVGRAGTAGDLEPSMSADERRAFEASAETLRKAVRGVLEPGGVA
jgi:malate/lactate dehydrogenase